MTKNDISKCQSLQKLTSETITCLTKMKCHTPEGIGELKKQKLFSHGRHRGDLQKEPV